MGVDQVMYTEDKKTIHQNLQELPVHQGTIITITQIKVPHQQAAVKVVRIHRRTRPIRPARRPQVKSKKGTALLISSTDQSKITL